MSSITTTAEVDRAPAEVFDYVTDPTRFVSSSGSATSSAGTWTPMVRLQWVRDA